MNDAHPDTFANDDEPSGALIWLALGLSFLAGLVIGGAGVATAGGLW